MPEDIVMGFGPPEGDREVRAALQESRRADECDDLRASGTGRLVCVEPQPDDPFIHQEIIEILYHTLWETVHVFFEHRELGHDVGEAAFSIHFWARRSSRPATWWRKSRPPSG